MNDSLSQWPLPWVRAALDLAILSSLSNEALHGYAIAERLEQIGMGRLKGGSLYPALSKLEDAGFIKAVWLPGESGPGRKAYSLTPAGAVEVDRLSASWNGLTASLNTLNQKGMLHD
ncbi:MAG: PadR family transcriptional regulator [Propionibacteriaceae bacterium]